TYKQRPTTRRARPSAATTVDGTAGGALSVAGFAHPGLHRRNHKTRRQRGVAGQRKPSPAYFTRR
ncbi:hypothetical protein, partial [Salmonella enterica]|uniref:hypothetical protein n=1 Tax=Salmonella enterica TaxID=28901 RepID=UPI00398C2F11